MRWKSSTLNDLESQYCNKNCKGCSASSLSTAAGLLVKIVSRRCSNFPSIVQNKTKCPLCLVYGAVAARRGAADNWPNNCNMLEKFFFKNTRKENSVLGGKICEQNGICNLQFEFATRSCNYFPSEYCNFLPPTFLTHDVVATSTEIVMWGVRRCTERL